MRTVTPVTRRHQLADAVLLAGLRARRALRNVVAGLTAPSFTVGVLVLTGTGLGIAAVHLLAGEGWALAAASGFAFGLAALVARGARRG